MIVHQAVAHAVGERLAEIIGVADVRRIGAHNMDDSTLSIAAATGGPCLLFLAWGSASAITS